VIAAALMIVTLTGNSSRTAAPVRPAAAVYVVQRGDCLWTVAARYLGDGDRWPLLYAVNRRTVGADPSLILPGEVLRLRLADDRISRRMVPKRATAAARPVVAVRHHRNGRPAGSSGSGAGIAGGTLDCAGLETLWDAAGGNPVYAQLAAAIAMAESGGMQYATGAAGEKGYWQINPVNVGMATYDPLGNAHSAVVLSRDGTDFSPWTTYTSGLYRGRC